eukprot:Skav207472  [mRNA]  locus=scaffold3545:496284:499559:- [translate_table: standard]
MRVHYDSIGCIKIKSVEVVNDKGEKYNIMNENLTNADENVSIYHTYIHTSLNPDADTIKRAINKGHYIKNQCWVNCFMDFYGDTLMSDKKKPENRLTIERISQIIGRDNFTEKGASINEMAQVFKEFGIQARIFTFFNKPILKYDPPKRNHNIKTFYAMVKNFHIYTLNHDLKSIQQKQDLDKPIVKASTDFYINNKEKPTYYKMIENVNDIIKLELEDDVKEVYLVMKDNNLTKALFDLTRNGYEPNIQHQINGITSIKMKFNNIKYTIKTQNLLVDSCDGCITVGTEQIYNNMQFAFFHLNKVTLNPSHKSYYSDIDLKILNESRTIVPCGLFTWDAKEVPKDIAEIDLSKAFTSSFINILKIGIFTQFDVWRKFDATTMDFQQMPDLTLYYVEVKSVWFSKICFNKQYNIIYGEVLKKIIKERGIVKLNIIAYKSPSKTEDVDYKGAIDEVKKVKISDDPDEDKNLKKLIANVTIGLLEKGGATDKKSLLFKNIAEALDCQSDYGGKLHKITEQEMVEDDEGDTYEGDETRNHYILNIKDTAELVNGFRYIKELLLQQHNFTMYEAYNKLRWNDINMYSVKTDAFVIDSKDVEKAKSLLNFHNDIGGWRVSKYGDDIILPLQRYELVRNEMIDIPTLECKELLIKDEYDTDNIIEVIKESNPVIITADFAGSGKSYICQKMVDKGYKVMFVTPTNKLLQEFEGEAITVNKFFGISFGSNKLEPFDYADYDVVVFDEIYFSNASTYWKIKQFIEKNKKDKIIIATGDGKQLKPVQELTNTRDHEEYTNEIIENIFDYRINLKICKRLHTDKDREKLNNIKIDIFVNKLSVKQIIEKYFSYTDDITSSPNNIAFLNDTCKNVSNAIRKLENRKGEYCVGEKLICREYTKTKTSVFNVNFKYKIVHIGNGMMTLKNVKTEILQSLPIDKVRQSFIFAHCCTAHSMQGSSVDTDITIFDYNHPLIRGYPEWLYVCITRSRDLNRVKFFRYKNDTDDEFNMKNITSYFERKIENYKMQDRNNKFTIPKEGYVNKQWFIKNIINNCNYCGCGFSISMNNGNVKTNLTCQRKQNELPHTLDNIIPYCIRCNCSCK